MARWPRQVLAEFGLHPPPRPLIEAQRRRDDAGQGTPRPGRSSTPHRGLTVVTACPIYWGWLRAAISRTMDVSNVNNGENRMGGKCDVWHYRLGGLRLGPA